jgi:hypothetical protein
MNGRAYDGRVYDRVHTRGQKVVDTGRVLASTAARSSDTVSQVLQLTISVIGGLFGGGLWLVLANVHAGCCLVCSNLCQLFQVVIVFLLLLEES